jgi:hypothetical protein
MDKYTYFVTELAGDTIGHIPNPGFGSEIMLTEPEARYHVLAGELSFFPTKVEEATAPVVAKAPKGK